MSIRTLLRRNTHYWLGAVLGQGLLILLATCLLAAILLPALTSG